MPILNLKNNFGLSDKKALLQDIKKAAGKGAGKSLSMTRKFQENGKDIEARVKLSNSENATRKRAGLDPNIGDAIAEAVASKIAYALSGKGLGYPAAPDVDYFVDGKGGVGLVSRYVPGGQGSIDDVHRKKLDEKHYETAILAPWLVAREGAPEMSKEEMEQKKEEMFKLRNIRVLNAAQNKALEDIEAEIKAGTRPPIPKYSKTLKLKSHAIITASDKEGLNVDLKNPNVLNVGGELKKEMYAEIIRRMMLGDHDNNPGNSLIVKDPQGREHIAGIDYGHAFNDLIKNFGPGRGHLPEGGGMLDALNRTSVNGGISKFRRDYRVVVSDPDFAEMLSAAASPGNVDTIRAAIQDAAEEIRGLKDSGVPEKELRESLQTICARMGHPIENPKSLSLDAIITHFQSNAALFVEGNMEEAASIANILKVQNEIDLAFREKRPTNMNLVQALYQQDTKYLKGKSPLSESRVTWVRNEEDKNPIKCSLADYIVQRTKQLSEAEKKQGRAKATSSLSAGGKKVTEDRAPKPSLFSRIKSGIESVVKFEIDFVKSMVGLIVRFTKATIKFFAPRQKSIAPSPPEADKHNSVDAKGGKTKSEDRMSPELQKQAANLVQGSISGSSPTPLGIHPSVKAGGNSPSSKSKSRN